MLNSIKQIYRTPVKLVLFIIAMIVSSMILVLGIVLLLYTNAELNALEESYTTIGTVEQKKKFYRSSFYVGCNNRNVRIFSSASVRRNNREVHIGLCWYRVYRGTGTKTQLWRLFTRIFFLVRG